MRKKEESQGIVFCVDCGLESDEITVDESFHVLGRPDKKGLKKTSQSVNKTPITTYADNEDLMEICIRLNDKIEQEQRQGRM